MEKGKVAGTSPKMENLEAGKNYAYCTCGESSKQTFCNGAHSGSDFKPMLFKVDEARTAPICTCKQTNNPPYCDGSHNSL
jgi:CDGSH-type Zn-finger protein